MCVSTYLAARMISKVTPIHVEHRVIIHMQKFMYEGVLCMLLVEEISLAKGQVRQYWERTRQNR